MKIIDVCCAIIEEKEWNCTRVWCARKGNGSHLAGLWEFPGGKIEPGESASQAIIREIREEMGVDVHVTDTLTPVIHDYGTHCIKLIPLICRIVNHAMPRPHDHEAIALMKTGSLRKLEWAPADLPVLEEYLLNFEQSGKNRL